jgi:hypothetical protein
MTEGLHEPLASVARIAPSPVRQFTLVRSDVKHTFDVFVRTIGVWWPTNPASAGRERTCEVTVEPKPGGRVYETWDDGTTVDWGRILLWQPPVRFVMSWVLTPEPTEVELTFTGLGPRLTRVSVEHRGWEALSEEQLREDCAAPGGYSSGAYSSGWAFILSRLAACAVGGTLPDRQPSDWAGAESATGG